MSSEESRMMTKVNVTSTFTPDKRSEFLGAAWTAQQIYGVAQALFNSDGLEHLSSEELLATFSNWAFDLCETVLDHMSFLEVSTDEIPEPDMETLEAFMEVLTEGNSESILILRPPES